jgi:hypothetical protein
MCASVVGGWNIDLTAGRATRTGDTVSCLNKKRIERHQIGRDNRMIHSGFTSVLMTQGPDMRGRSCLVTALAATCQCMHWSPGYTAGRIAEFV